MVIALFLILVAGTPSAGTVRDLVLSLEGKPCPTLSAPPSELHYAPVLLRGLARDSTTLHSWSPSALTSNPELAGTLVSFGVAS